MRVVRVDACDDRDRGIRELGERREHGGRLLQPDVVEAECEEPGDDREVGDPEGVVPPCERLAAVARVHDREGDAAAGQPEEEAEAQDLLELELAAEVPAEHRPERPEHRGGECLDDRDEPLRLRVERVRLVDEPEAEEGGQQEPGEARPRPLAEDERRARDRHERLDLLDHDGCDEVAVEERLREEDRRERRRPGSDRDRRGDVARSRPQDRPQRGKQQTGGRAARGSRARRRRSSSRSSSRRAACGGSGPCPTSPRRPRRERPESRPKGASSRKAYRRGSGS